MHSRSYHFIPANRPGLFCRTVELGADAYIFDLEDAVPTGQKRQAVMDLKKHLTESTQGARFFVRVNGIGHKTAESERELFACAPSVGIVVPKVESAQDLVNAVEFYGIRDPGKIVVLIESAKGVQEVDSILKLKLASAVGLGLEDLLSKSVFLQREVTGLVKQIRARISLAAMSSGVEAIDTISTDINGGPDLHHDIASAKTAGFTAKFSIHPSQIQKINEAFSPNKELISLAKNLRDELSAWNEESGYFKHDGEIISPPKLKKLKNVLKFIQKFHL